MFQEDYILRLVQQVTDAIARITGLNRSEHHERALDEASSAWDALGVPRALVHAIDIATLVAMLREPIKMRLGAQLLVEEAHALSGQGDPARAAVRSRRALELLLEAREIDPGAHAQDEAMIAALSRVVPIHTLAPRHRALV